MNNNAPPAPPVVPVPSAFPVTTQPKLQAGLHWQTIAQDAARALASHLQRGQRCGFSHNPCRALYVAKAQEETEFSRAFVNALITALVQQGLIVSQDDNGALALHVDVQSVHFGRGAGLGAPLKSLAPGLWTTGGDGSRVDAPPGERSEIIVTLSALDGNRYAARSTNVYYVGNVDLSLYEQEICSLMRPCHNGKAVSPARKAPIPLIGDPTN
ncbi:hypothetical protein AGMMS49545_15090 [Betaproteobacteria bacterium]|nr:hypothetical protein AGMMS49545_15090 [Betaproteobacteria bacterium]GHU46142.1 hypothetical protein AGMMS50289_18840 [Betaproteobacteria bacterium]